MDRRHSIARTIRLLMVMHLVIFVTHGLRTSAEGGPLCHWQREEFVQPLHKAATEALDAAAIRGSPYICTGPVAIDLGRQMACFTQIVPNASRQTTDDAWWMWRIVDGTPRPHCSCCRNKRVQRHQQPWLTASTNLLVLLTLPQPPTPPRILTNLTCAGGGAPTHPILYQVRKVLVKRSLTIHLESLMCVIA